jgi:hypothetical protein
MTEVAKKAKNINSAAERELDKVGKQFDEFEASIKEMTKDRLDAAPKQEVEPQTKLSQNEIAKSKEIYLKPSRSISSREKFNEKYRDEYNFQKEYVNFIAEHGELIGNVIETWTKKFPGLPAEFWEVPSGVPVWAPRYVAERIANCKYHRLTMKENIATEVNGAGTMYGKMAADTTIQRLNALPVNKRKSVFMGAESF